MSYLLVVRLAVEALGIVTEQLNLVLIAPDDPKRVPKRLIKCHLMQFEDNPSICRILSVLNDSA